VRCCGGHHRKVGVYELDAGARDVDRAVVSGSGGYEQRQQRRGQQHRDTDPDTDGRSHPRPSRSPRAPVLLVVPVAPHAARQDFQFGEFASSPPHRCLLPRLDAAPTGRALTRSAPCLSDTESERGLRTDGLSERAARCAHLVRTRKTRVNASHSAPVTHHSARPLVSAVCRGHALSSPTETLGPPRRRGSRTAPSAWPKTP
jgi:hypothetical protein